MGECDLTYDQYSALPNHDSDNEQHTSAGKGNKPGLDVAYMKCGYRPAGETGSSLGPQCMPGIPDTP